MYRSQMLLEVVQVGALDLGGLLVHAVVTELIVQGHVGQVAGEAPGRGAFQAGGGEGVEAQLSGAGVDVVSDGLQGREVLDLIQRVAGLVQRAWC